MQNSPLQAVPTEAHAAAAGDSTALLLEHANYWRSRGDFGTALKDLQRILSYAPGNPDVLAAAAELAFQMNDYDAANRYRALLAQAAPNDPRNQALAAEHQPTPQEAELLRDARRLAQGGKNAEAVAQYRQFFHDTVPPSLAIEYYPALASTSPDGFDEARQKLGALADRYPENASLQLAYAKILIVQEDSRREGIKRLQALTSNPEIGNTARQAWREVLLWQGASERTRLQLLAYLQDNPTDPQIEAKRREFDAALPDASAKALILGYSALAGNDKAKAEQEFKAALASNPNNPDALVMLAVIRRSQQHFAEAQMLIDKAVAVAPERRAELLRLAGGVANGPIQPSMDDQVQVATLGAMGKYDEAEQLFSRMIAGHESAAALTQLGSLQVRAHHIEAAEESFRKANTLNAGMGDPVCALAGIAVERKHFDEAADLYAKAALLFTKAKDRNGMRRVAIGREALLQSRTAQRDDPSQPKLDQTVSASNR